MAERANGEGSGMRISFGGATVVIEARGGARAAMHRRTPAGNPSRGVSPCRASVSRLPVAVRVAARVSCVGNVVSSEIPQI